MNIFENESGILGSASLDNLKRSFEEFFKQATEIRIRLGNHGYLLDKYLSYLFETTNGILAYEAASEGFETESTLSSLCTEILRGDVKSNDHPFYEQVKAFIDAHPLKYQESFTKLSLYDVMLSCSYLESVYEQYYSDIIADIRAFLDIVDLNSLYNKICETLGREKDMEHLNLLFCQRFLIVKAMDIFLQGMNNQLLYSLTYRDRETSKQVLQLLLDEAFYR
jgi:ribosomal protein L31